MNFGCDIAAAREPLKIASATEAVQDDRIHIEKLNDPFLFKTWSILLFAVRMKC